MSHVAKVQIEIRDLKILERACARAGLELVLGQKTFYGGYFERECTHAIKPASDAARAEYRRTAIDSEFEFPFGVVAKEKGGFELAFETMQSRFCDPFGNELKKSYAAVAAIEAARKNGFRIQERRLATGEIKLILLK